MIQIENISALEREKVFRDVGKMMGIHPGIIEKDFWVSYVLNSMFSDSFFHDNIIFKGGTSLSKVYSVIQRFSEDIDLIINWELLTDKDPYENRSNTQQLKFNEELNEFASLYIRNELSKKIGYLTPKCKIDFVTDDPLSIILEYPREFQVNYILPYIKLEFGPLAAWTPHSQHKIRSYVADAYPETIQENLVPINVVDVERTFWEKATILHHEANRPQNSKMPARYSRHYYDLYMLSNNKELCNRAIDKSHLLIEVAKFKNKFYHRGWAQYDLARIGTLKLEPPSTRIDDLKKDYANMKEMLFGDTPIFDSIIKSISKFEDLLNKKI
jgi:hypothetical protein